MSRGVSKPRGVPGKIAKAVALHEAEPNLPINAIAERCGISRSSVVKGLAAHADRQAYQRREYVAAGVDRHAALPAPHAAVSAERLTAPQIYGLETWLQHVDPDEPVTMPRLVIDAVQAIIEEVRERRDADGRFRCPRCKLVYGVGSDSHTAHERRGLTTCISCAEASR